jgi:UDP-N-acetylmuramyl pentapeptide phosphotransferase/UDP-N-acetylglucosamine-1-phosphate transferase
MEHMRFVSRHRWSVLSIVITLGTAFVTLAAIQYLYHHGTWRPQSALGGEIDGSGGLAVLISFVLAAIALAKEKPRTYGIIALCLSVLSFLLYVR